MRDKSKQVCYDDMQDLTLCKMQKRIMLLDKWKIFLQFVRNEENFNR